MKVIECNPNSRRDTPTEHKLRMLAKHGTREQWDYVPERLKGQLVIPRQSLDNTVNRQLSR